MRDFGFEFTKGDQLFIRVHNETFAANAAIMVSIVRSIGGTNRPLQFQKRRQLFIRVHNVTLSVAAMRVSNPDRSPVCINRGDITQAPTVFLDVTAMISQ